MSTMHPAVPVSTRFRRPFPGSGPLAAALAAGLLGAVLGACQDTDVATGPDAAPETAAPHQLPTTPPLDLVGVTYAGETMTLWPFTGSGPSAEAVSDPVNLILVGRAHPLEVRAALLALDGQRSPPFPAAFPFDCTWKDAMGRPQATYGEEAGWTGSAVQLECGEYDPIRFHLRLFDLGGWTAANAHMDLLIPGTSEHQVIAWEAAEQFVVFDLARTGLLGAPPAQTGPINAAPSWRTIPDPIYDGIPASLRSYIGGPADNADAPVPILTDGKATIVYLAGAAAREPGSISRNRTLVFNQVVPRPFCSTGPADYIRLEGPLAMDLSVSELPSGGYHSLFNAAGRLTVTPVNPLTGQPTGESSVGEVKEHHTTRIDDSGAFVEFQTLQIVLPAGGGSSNSKLTIRWIVGGDGSPQFTVGEDC